MYFIIGALAAIGVLVFFTYKSAYLYYSYSGSYLDDSRANAALLFLLGLLASGAAIFIWPVLILAIPPVYFAKRQHDKKSIQE